MTNMMPHWSNYGTALLVLLAMSASADGSSSSSSVDSAIGRRRRSSTMRAASAAVSSLLPSRPAAPLRPPLWHVPRGGEGAKSIEPLPPPANAREAAARTESERTQEGQQGQSTATATAAAAATPAAPATVQRPAAAAAPTTPDHTKSTKTKLANFTERAPPAVLMGLAVYAILKFGGESGLIGLVLFLQVGMYHETTSIVEEHHTSTTAGSGARPTPAEQLEKWWWFGTVVVGTSLRNLVERSAHLTHEAMDLVCYGMGAVGLLGAVVGMASHAEAGPERFRDYLGTVAGCWFSLLFLVGQSSFWIKTVHEFGLEWVLYPALLVIVNDTMAYVFGLTMGNRKLLPRLSPKKTVEGFVGAAFSTAAISVPLLKAILGRGGRDLPADVVRTALIMGAFTSIVSPFGGFLASAVKRAHGAKDFGKLIPGHGGVVDRFDCQIVTAPFVYLFLKYAESGALVDVA